MKKRLVQGFKLVDANGDGGLDARELHALNRRQQQARDTQDGQQAPAAR